MARAWPADGIRLDAYDAETGAGRCYAACGFEERGRVVYRANPLAYYELLLGQGDGGRAAVGGFDCTSLSLPGVGSRESVATTPRRRWRTSSDAPASSRGLDAAGFLVATNA